MVRLEATINAKYLQPNIVSIPLWFDWKSDYEKAKKNQSSFQFHFGSIGSLFGRLTLKKWPCFNSTLVRLEAGGIVRVTELAAKFQFHFGSIGRNITLLLYRDVGVSIPLWFDWKQLNNGKVMKDNCFNSTLVRLEEKCRINLFALKRVSIPLWFDWKHCVVILPRPFYSFQFHFGSIGS